MGRLARRLQNRQHPLFERARDLRSCALESWRSDDDDGELFDLIEEAFTSLSAEEFDTLVSLAVEDCELLEDGDNVSETLLDAVMHVSQTLEDPDEPTTCVLFALPLELTLDPQRYGDGLPTLDVDQCAALQALLVEHELLAEDSDVSFLPRLLHAQEADALAPADVFELSRSLASGDESGAVEYLDQFAEQRRGPELPIRDATGLTTRFAVVMGLLRSDDEVPFVLARLLELEHQALHTGRPSARSREEHDELFSDLAAELDQLAEPMAELLGVPSVRVVRPADRWNDGAFVALKLERVVRAKALLQRLAQECSNDLSALTVGRPVVDKEQLTFPVLRRSDGATLGVLPWRDGRRESWQEALAHLVELLAQLNVAPTFDHEDLPDADRPLH